MNERPAIIIRITRRHWNEQAVDMRSTLMTWEWRWARARQAERVVIDFREVEFMEPWALAMFACFGLTLHHEGVQVEVQLDMANPSNRHFAAMGLNEIVTQSARPAQANLTESDSGLHLIRSIRDAERFAARAAELVVGLDEDAALRVKYCVEELGRNAMQHGHSPAGAVAIAQRFPASGHVQIAICDSGRGVRESLKFFYPELVTDLEALRLAVLPRTSGAAPAGVYAGGSGDLNQGLGLFFTREIAWRAGGSFWLASGDGLLGIRSGDENGSHRVYRTINRWEGTLAAVHLPDRSVSDFSDLLTLCHRLVQDVERDASVAALDFVDDSSEFPDDAIVIPVGAVQSDLGGTEAIREQELMPGIEQGRQVVLDFSGVRFLSTSVAQALLGLAFRTPGSLTKLSFRNCSRPTQAAIRTSAALARASYRMRPAHD